MFTGIVAALGRVVSVEERGDVVVLEIATPLAAELPNGGSIAVNGCCLTALDIRPDRFRCDLTPETMRRTAFGRRLAPEAAVNLERPVRADGRLEGHIVQGHVDATGELVEMRWSGEAAEAVYVLPAEIERWVVSKGSIAVDGVSLTVAGLEPGRFTVALIPHTLEVTTLGRIRPGDPVNLEADILAKHVERLMAGHAPRS